jgi:hypothetical protein
LTAASSPLYAFGTGDFTIEAWVYTTSSTTQRIVSLGTGNNGELLLVNSGSNVWLDWFDGTVDIGSNTTFVTQNAWVHVAVTRSSSTVRVFINGIVSGTPTTSTRSYGTVATYIGTYGGSVNTQNFIGYISNFRMVNGTALYTTNFTPPTQPLQSVNNTVLLLNGTNTGIVDRSENNNLVTVGNTSLSTTQTRFNPTSIFFDGTGDYLVAPVNPSLYILSGNFTIECWVYPTGLTGTRVILSQWNQTAGQGGYILNTSGNQFQFYFAPFSEASPIITGSTTITANQWYHLAVVRNGSTFTMYQNGVSIGTGTSSATKAPLAVNTAMGTYYNSSGTLPAAGTTDFAGYVDDVRITPGVARYTANFTPPTYSPLGF